MLSASSCAAWRASWDFSVKRSSLISLHLYPPGGARKPVDFQKKGRGLRPGLLCRYQTSLNSASTTSPSAALPSAAVPLVLAPSLPPAAGAVSYIAEPIFWYDSERSLKASCMRVVSLLSSALLA